ncbi:MAG: hypothetical protein AAB019_04360 [Planctomycetota bacterium]
MEEQVYIVPREKLFEGKPLPQGFGRNNPEQLLQLILQHGRFEPRSPVEINPDLKQIIPYLIVSCNDKILTLHRQSAQTEKRLHDKYSIGVGGHINPVELKSQITNLSAQSDGVRIPSDKSQKNATNIIEKGLERELHEELHVNCSYQHKLVGFLNDDSNAVGQVHFGLVFKVEVADEKSVTVAEKELMNGQFMTLSEIEPLYPRLETWSQLVFDNLLRKT